MAAMRYGLSIALILALAGPLGAAESEFAEHLERLHGADAAKRPTILSEMARVVVKLASVPAEDRKTLAAILGELKSAIVANDKAVASAGWSLASPVVALTKPLTVPDAAWFLENAASAWCARLNDDVAAAAIRAAARSLFDGTRASALAGKAAERALKKALRTKGKPGQFLAIAVGLARAPDDRARALLLRVLPRKKMSDEHAVEIIVALGEGGGPSAAPILLRFVPGTAAAILEATLIALSKLEPRSLR